MMKKNTTNEGWKKEIKRGQKGQKERERVKNKKVKKLEKQA